jgi:hypothetical protein
MADLEPVTLKFSSKRVTTSSKYAWSVGITKDFLANHPELPIRLQIHQENRSIYIVFSDTGSLLSTTLPGKVRWAVFSSLHLYNFYGPTNGMLRVDLDGLYDATKARIEVDKDQYTDMMVRCMDPQPPPELRNLESGDTFKVKPRQSKVFNVKTKPEGNLFADDFVEPPRREKPSTNELVPYSLPTRVSLWHDDNIRNLKTLIMDLQSRRPDIVFQVINGIVTMRKQTFEEI